MAEEREVNAAQAYHLMKHGGPWTPEEVDAEGTVRSIKDARTGRVVRLQYTGAGAFGPGGRLLPGPAWDYTEEGRAIGNRLAKEGPSTEK